MAVDLSELHALSSALRLDFSPQDWGIINATPERLHEFMTYYRQNRAGFSRMQLFAMMELILASADEALEPGNPSAQQIALEVDRFLRQSMDGLLPHLSYWGSLDPDTHPVTRVVQKVSTKQYPDRQA